MESLRGLLASAGLPQLLPLLEEEELSPALLRSMPRHVLLECLHELHVPHAQAIRLADSQELFCEDVTPPPHAARWDDRRLRAFFESGGVEEGEEKEGVEREEREERGGEEEVVGGGEEVVGGGEEVVGGGEEVVGGGEEVVGGGEEVVGGGEEVVGGGEAVGRLVVRWRGLELPFAYSAASEVRQLKASVARRTLVAAAQQKLMGWAAREVSDGTRICEVAPRAGRLMLLGTPAGELLAAAEDLERSRRTARLIANDLFFKGSLDPNHANPKAAPRRRQVHDRRPINAAHGSGICLDPYVWAPPIEETRPSSGFVLHPASRRLEPLGMHNALLRAGPGDAPRDDFPPQEPRGEPANVDITGQVRGRCNGCTRCPGFQRRDELVEEAGETEMHLLRCVVCDCDCTRHEALGVPRANGRF
ncbi:hypothetical protein AB1Y20_001833 [Prymnesium parvum]|uniref:Uncharacterized protein n=1 Tax=Prymnesium parvum TaxID=97485 RepID=A0AB34KCH9_PRYPA